MKLSFFQTITLYCLNKINDERTTALIYHLLRGRKSSQTIQDAHLFELTNLYQTIPSLKRADLIKTIRCLEQAQLIAEKSTNVFYLTSKGQATLDTALINKPIPKYLNGWKYHQLTTPFWERLSLLVQVCSNLINNENSYIPIQSSNETKSWIKQFLRKTTYNREDLAKQLFNELSELLSESKDIDPQAFVIRLTGYSNIGLTAIQAAKILEMEVTEYTYHFLNVLHYLIKSSTDNKERYILLSSLCQFESLPLTNSTQKTYQLLQKGHSINDISTVRNLRKSTIEDHLVEIALIDKQFQIEQYVNNKEYQLIVSAINELNTRQLKVLKDYVPNVSYFQIRLVLAKYGDQ